MPDLDSEISPRLNKLIRPLVLTERVIWLAITGSVLFYCLMAFVLAGSGSPRIGSAGLDAVIYAAALSAAGFSAFYRRRALSDERISLAMKNGEDFAKLTADPRTKSIDTEHHSILESLDAFEKAAYALMAGLQKTTLISLVLNEFVVVLGFVLAFLSGDPYKIIPFGFAALLLNLWMFPRPGTLIRRARSLYTG